MKSEEDADEQHRNDIARFIHKRPSQRPQADLNRIRQRRDGEGHHDAAPAERFGAKGVRHDVDTIPQNEILAMRKQGSRQFMPDECSRKEPQKVQPVPPG
jgi:hypothetical protein